MVLVCTIEGRRDWGQGRGWGVECTLWVGVGASIVDFPCGGGCGGGAGRFSGSSIAFRL